MRLPPLRRRVERSYDEMLAELEPSLKPYRDERPAMNHLPAEGRAHKALLAEMAELAAREEGHWRDGFVSGAVYHGDPEHIALLNQVYALDSQTNPLHADIWPSADPLRGRDRGDDGGHARRPPGLSPGEQVCGTVTSGGTESILLAMKTYRDYARARRGVRRPEIVVPTTAHAAFDKAAQYFGIRLVRVPVGPDYRADVAAMGRAITRRTIALVGSAPTFPHGAIDPIDDLAGLARARGVGLHVDACLGGFVLPWARRLGYPVPPFDFRRAGRDLDVGRHPQVRLRGQGHLGGPLPRARAAPLPVLHRQRLAGRAVLLADLRRQPARRR